MSRLLRSLRAVWGWLVDDRPERVEGWMGDEYAVLLEERGGEGR
ncbi:hypothetical protein [Amycolatopsis pigmentata]|uniref:Uncharacterized protein n=1 Tax=Amycolatopsis pigmentata TaxID=450801 RepID=A0ABW5G7C3_9PSEU